MKYRAASEDAPCERIIDPGYIEVAGDAAYLVAWNVVKGGQRSYRLDRIDSVELTEDSVIDHPFVRLSAAESLQKHGNTAKMRWSTQEAFDASTWAGIDRDSAKRNDDGTVEANVSYTSTPWLFDQVLAAGGELIIERRMSSELLSSPTHDRHGARRPNYRWLARQSSR